MSECAQRGGCMAHPDDPARCMYCAADIRPAGLLRLIRNVRKTA